MKNIFKTNIVNGIQSIIVSMIVLLVGASLIRSFSHQLCPISNSIIKEDRGMIANIVGGFIVILIGISLIGTVSQEAQNAFCGSNQTSSLLETISESSDDQPIGPTDSFGGGGAEHFGGYTGTVEHKNWFANLAPIKTDKSMFFSGDNCIDPSSTAGTMLNLLPFFFGLVIVMSAIMMIYSSLRNSGMLGGVDL